MSIPRGQCHRCGASWKFADSHCTYYKDGVGLAPLCETCWIKLSPEQRLPFYRSLWLIWLDDPINDKSVKEKIPLLWPLIESAVLDGK